MYAIHTHGRRPSLLALLWCCALFCATIVATANVDADAPPASSIPSKDIAAAEAVMQQAFKIDPNDPAGKAQRQALLFRALNFDPWNGNALVQLGMQGMTRGPADRERAFAFLKRAFSKQCRPHPIHMQTPQGVFLATMLGRRAAELNQFEESAKFLDMAAEVTK